MSPRTGRRLVKHQVVLWSVTGIVALILALGCLTMIVFLTQANHQAEQHTRSTLRAALVADCTVLKADHTAILRLFDRPGSDQSAKSILAEAYRQSEAAACKVQQGLSGG